MFELLLVDDDPAILEMLAVALQQPGVVLHLARSPEQALEAVFDAPVDAAVIDVHLTPECGAEGLELLHRLQQSRPPTPVVIITGAGDPTLLARAYRLGARYFLRKPLLMEELEFQLRLLGLPQPSEGEDPGDVRLLGRAWYSSWQRVPKPA